MINLNGATIVAADVDIRPAEISVVDAEFTLH
jgi:hypothetical protein